MAGAPPGYVEGGLGGRGGGRDCRGIGLGGRFVDVGDVDGDCYGGIDSRGGVGFDVAIFVLAVADADGYGVGLRGLIVEAGVGGHGDLSCGRVDGEQVRAGTG